MINRRVTRSILNTTETTDKTNSPTSNTLSFVFLTTDAFYVGFQGPFAARYFKMGTVNTNSATLTVKYWNGSTWANVEDLVDQTYGFTQSGFIHWQNVGDWVASEQTPVTDKELFWIKITTSANLSAGTTLQAVLNLFCDDALVTAYYPEIISDTRYLPSGKTDFLEQYIAAKDLVVLRLKQRQLIGDESHIIDINAVSIAAIHAFAKVLLSPIATNDETKERLNQASRDFEDEVSRLSLGVDQNKDGLVSEAEEQDFGSTFMVRR